MSGFIAGGEKFKGRQLIDFEQLSERLRRGETDALAEVWEHYGNELRRRARTRLRQFGIQGMTESMDICNGVLVDLARKGTIELRHPSDLVHYVMKAIDNHVLDLFRELSRQRRDYRRVDGNPVEDHAVFVAQDTPSIELLRREVIGRIRSDLGPEHARIVDLVLENCSWQEIGEAMSMQPDTVRMRLRRSIERVKKELLDDSDAEFVDD